MAEFQKPQSKKEFEQNFAQKKPVMNETEAYYESSRCLFCYDAPCIKACPTGINIPLFIRQIGSGNPVGAAQTIYNSNYFGFACGKVCPTAVLCEGVCVYNEQNIKPVEIGRLQSYVTGMAIKKKKKLFIPSPDNGKKIAIIGAGPAGISCACELRMLGYQVDIFELKDKPSGLIFYGIAPYKITNENALNEIQYLQDQFGYKVYYNHPLQNKKHFDELENNYEAIFIGIGLGKTSSINLPGENLENCIGAIEFIEKLRIQHHKAQIGKKVIVLGGGNTAMDTASESCRMGAEQVTLVYRRSKKEMPAYEFEYDLARSAGAKGLFNAAPVEIMGNNKVEGVKFIRTRSGSSKANEKPKLKTIPDSEFTLNCDMVIKATGQSKQVELFSLIPGLKLDKGKIVVNKENHQTSNLKYFAAGDCVNGGKEVVNAVAEANIAARGIHSYLTIK